MEKFFLLLIPFALFGQKKHDEVRSGHFLFNRKCHALFHALPSTKENPESILATLPRIFSNSEIHFRFTDEQQSPGGKHYSFVQQIGGMDVYQSQVRVNTDGRGNILSVFDNSVHAPNLIFESLQPASSLNHVQSLVENKHLERISEMWVPVEGNYLRNAYVMQVGGKHGEWTEIIADNNAIIFQRDMNMYFAPPDSTAKGFVFLPDPLTTANRVYGGIYVDNFDADAQWLTDERKEVSITADFENGTFHLRNAYVRLSDYDAPLNGVSTSSAPEFYFTRSQSGFEEVNALYHISEFGKYVQQMGFSNANALVEVDAHAVNGADNSYFSFNFNPMRLYFGEGGVDDAEDADVCVHEYSHFLSYRASPNSNVGAEREALDEAFCDYNAASYSRAINSFNWGRVYNWDGHNEFWSGRVVNSSKIYPTNLVSSIYRNGEIWSSMLMQLWSDLGKSVTDKLIFQAHFSYAQNISFLDAANILIQADQQLFGGIHYCQITQRLHERGLLPAGKTLCPVGIFEANTELPVSMTQKSGGLMIASLETVWNAIVEISDVNGKIVYSQPMLDGTHFVAGERFSHGVYLVRVSSATRQKFFKWLK